MKIIRKKSLTYLLQMKNKIENIKIKNTEAEEMSIVQLFKRRKRVKRERKISERRKRGRVKGNL